MKSLHQLWIMAYSIMEALHQFSNLSKNSEVAPSILKSHLFDFEVSPWILKSRLFNFGTSPWILNPLHELWRFSINFEVRPSIRSGRLSINSERTLSEPWWCDGPDAREFPTYVVGVAEKSARAHDTVGFRPIFGEIQQCHVPEQIFLRHRRHM